MQIFGNSIIERIKEVNGADFNISEDHLDRHSTMKEYIQLKMDLAKNLKKEGFIIYNSDDNELHKALKNNPDQKQTFSTISKETLFYLEPQKGLLIIKNPIRESI